MEKTERAFSAGLLEWYAKNKRKLPWRDSSDPYKVWVSEALLQQTRVEQAKPYYSKFLQKFPTVSALADAPLDNVLKEWEGLGYYARARNLHSAARKIQEEHGSKIPADEKTLSQLPGFGPYTTNAVLSLAFNKDLAVTDGNVARILARVFLLEEDVRTTQGRLKIQALAQELLPPGKARDWNQALMDLGSLVCTPRTAACTECPLEKVCEAHRTGAEESYPRKKKQKTRPVRKAVALLAKRGENVLFVQRPAKGFLGGLWSLPQLENGSTREFAKEFGLKSGKKLGSVRHEYSHFTLELEVYGADGQPKVGKWARPEEVALDGATKRALELVAKS